MIGDWKEARKALERVLLFIFVHFVHGTWISHTPVDELSVWLSWLQTKEKGTGSAEEVTSLPRVGRHWIGLLEAV